MRERGDKAAVHRLRGRRSNRRLDQELKEKTIALLRDPKLRDLGRRLPRSIGARSMGAG